MKRTISILCAAILAATTLTNCASTGADQKAQSAQLANLANIVVNTMATANPEQAALIRGGGALVIKAVNGEDIKVEEASALAIALAVNQKKITPEQAEELRAVTTVPLGPSNPLLPPPGAGL